MTPPKAECPFEKDGLPFDRPIATPDMVGSAAVEHVLRAEIYDTHVHGLKQFWDDENAFLARLQEQVDVRRQAS